MVCQSETSMLFVLDVSVFGMVSFFSSSLLSLLVLLVVFLRFPFLDSFPFVFAAVKAANEAISAAVGMVKLVVARSMKGVALDTSKGRVGVIKLSSFFVSNFVSTCNPNVLIFLSGVFVDINDVVSVSVLIIDVVVGSILDSSVDDRSKLLFRCCTVVFLGGGCQPRISIPEFSIIKILFPCLFLAMLRVPLFNCMNCCCHGTMGDDSGRMLANLWMRVVVKVIN